MRHNKKSLKSWLWLGYPLAVIVFIGVSANVLMAYRENLTKKWESREVIAQDEMLLSDLQKRLSRLEMVDKAVETEDLKQMVIAVPPVKTVWALVAHLKLAASESGVILESYKGIVGEVKEATPEAEITEQVNQPLVLNAVFLVESLDRLGDLLANLERRTPLLKVNKLRYAEQRLELTVEGAWKAHEKTAGSNIPLPEYAESLRKVKQDLLGFTQLEQIAVESLGDTGVVNPF